MGLSRKRPVIIIEKKAKKTMNWSKRSYKAKLKE